MWKLPLSKITLPEIADWKWSSFQKKKKNEAKRLREKNLENSQAYRDQPLSIWSGSTDSNTLDYQRTNPREYQIARTHTNETT